ncbi:hypothetical protein BKA57DRAFT_458020 [Linnemannia elongata]|nr:hypothetical protein BGZ88_011615 [Linnemannia elongata]KAH7051810.1 hypothetical protein BKA57DRAFT_458020 [Linnemannia elongata]KAK5816159.1 hypothetical protein F5H01DRAFT_343793 [Linnemannia elongata]
MASLKHELDQWNEGVIAFDQGQYEDALEYFEPIADSAKIHFNIGVVLATLGDFEGAGAAYEQATKLDQYLAIAYFQNGVANVALENYAKALTCFHDAYLYLRGNMVIDYTQLGLDFKLYSCQVLFNRALCYIELGEMDLGMTDLWRATREKQTKAHDMLDQALRDKGQDCTVFTVPQGVLYRPAESKVKNSKKKDYLGNSKVIAAVDASDQFAGFKGKSAWQVQMSGPTNVASSTEESRPMTPPNGLQRRATERVVPGGVTGRARRDTDPERPHMLEHAASFNGTDAMTRRGPGPSALGPAGSEPRPQMLTRRNTEAQRPSPLDIDNSAYPPTSRSNGPNSAAPGGPGAGGRNRYQDDMDDVDQYINALSLDSQQSPSDLRVSPIPTRSNTGNVRPGMHRNQSPNGPSPPPSVYDGNSPPNGRSVGPVVADLRRMGSNTRGLKREDSVRSNASGGMYQGSQMNSSPLAYSNSVSSNGTPRSEEGSSYLDEPVYAGLRDKLRVKCHYIDTRAVLVRVDTSLQELLQKVQEKFQADRPLKLKYKDEDHHMLSMIDDEDWLMAQQVQMETQGTLDRMELWCFDDD